ncbi:hypothetical protein B7P43_G03143, partial [Cryptotermes secundus]
VTVLPHPPYSPDLAPCDFFLFHRVKAKLRGRRFQSSEETTQKESHVIAISPVCWHAYCCLATSKKHSSYCYVRVLFLFPKLKEILKGRYFGDIDVIGSNMTAALKVIPQNQFQNCFEGWTRRWHQCKFFLGEYFESDHSDIQQ